MPNKNRSHSALVLPGAVAKGAYEAGVIQVLVESHLKIDRIVATSSGALNGVALAAGVRNGSEAEIAKRLVSAWIENGNWYQALTLNPIKWLTGKGLCSRDGLLKMLKNIILPCTTSTKKEVELRIIVAPLNGIRGSIGKTPATTYEKVLHFSGEDFDTSEGLSKIFDATTAACSFPGLFAPVELDGLGPCLDGGTVNNAPIKYALDEGDIGRIFMPVPFPLIMPHAKSMGGMTLVNHLIEILINERVYRDLKNAEVVNEDIRKLESLVKNGTISEEQFKAVKKILEIRFVSIREIRPSHSLRGNSFSGFFSKRERMHLVQEGRRAALRELGAHNY